MYVVDESRNEVLARAMAALRRQLAKIPDGKLTAIARRAGISVRQLQRLRGGEMDDVKVSTLAGLATVLKTTPSELLGGGASPHARRPAPVGRRRGKPRNMRRQGDVGESTDLEEDDDTGDDV